jgi:RAQPRD family integrative conjugative element protein
MKTAAFALFAALHLLPLTAKADFDQERAKVQQILNHLSAVKPLLNEVKEIDNSGDQYQVDYRQLGKDIDTIIHGWQSARAPTLLVPHQKIASIQHSHCNITKKDR